MTGTGWKRLCRGSLGARPPLFPAAAAGRSANGVDRICFTYGNVGHLGSQESIPTAAPPLLGPRTRVVRLR